MDKKQTKYLVGFILTTASTFPFAGEELPVNPFTPILTESGGEGGADVYDAEKASKEYTHPLQKFPVKEYTLMGIIASENGDVAMIRSVEGQEYFIHVGDLIGSNGGYVSNINGRGIEVKEKDRVVFLAVRNRSIFNDDEQK